jgi:hypothetical protein
MLTRKSVCRESLLATCIHFPKLLNIFLRSARLNVPCTVAFAPAAVSKPIDPTIKYWNTRFDTSGLLALYLAKLGILFVSYFVKGESKLEPEVAAAAVL